MRREEKKIPEGGDTRTVRKFLLLPKNLNKQWRWLEKSNIMQKYVCSYAIRGGGYIEAHWRDIGWVSDSEYIRYSLHALYKMD